ncbi:EAL domain-containing protein [Escherichia coli]|nr:EAL domain-containing protein [Escherichia coli]EGJ6409984.1 EAL domain-containing protein [Escherichia coli]RFQ16820.1 hypothetical protein CRD86_25355 [Escherichia coli]
MKSDAVSADRLLNALNNGEFEPYIQSVVRASDLTVSGGELLVRWHMLEGKIHLPERFCHERCNSEPHPTPEIRSRG